MSFTIGNITFTSKKGETAVSGYPTDVLVGKSRVWVLNKNMNSVYIYNKNTDGTIGTYITSQNWVSYDSYIQYICTSASSVPYSYAVYVENGQDYLVGWSGNHSALFVWQLHPTGHYPYNRVQYNVCPTNAGSYGRGGWDGGRYVYFLNRNGNYLYRWDLFNKNNPVERLGYVSNIRSLDSSYTGSGMLIKGPYVYWGDGSNESNGLLGCWNWSTGATVGSVMTYSDLSSIPNLTAINRSYGTIQFSPLNPNVAYYFYFNTSKIVYINTSGMFIPSFNINTPIYDEDVVVDLKFDAYPESLETTIGYRLLVNGTQVFPSIVGTYTAQVPLPATQRVTLANKYFNVGSNIVKVEGICSATNVGLADDESTYRIVDCQNKIPQIVASLSRSSTHGEPVRYEATITDGLKDTLSWQILLNGVAQTGWASSAYPPPQTITRMFKPSELVTGINTITLLVKDTYKENTNNTSLDTIIVKENQLPTIDCITKGHTLYLTFDDPDKDAVKFRIFLNGSQILPTAGWSAMFPVPLDVNYTLPKDKVMLDRANTIKIECMDSAGDIQVYEFSRLMSYTGLMFKDVDGNYYSTDDGGLIKYLDLGTVYARETSAIFPVLVENTFGYPMCGLVVTALQGDLDPITEVVQLSYSNDPFDPLPQLLFNDTVLNTGDTIMFYVRLKASPEAMGGGKFKLKVCGQPGAFAIGAHDMLATLKVANWTEEEIESTIDVKYRDNPSLNSSLLVRRSADDSLPGNLILRLSGSKDLQGSIKLPLPEDYDLNGSIGVLTEAQIVDVTSNIAVRRSTSDDLSSNLGIWYNAEEDIHSTIEVYFVV